MAQREIRGRQTGPGFLRSGESGYGGARAWGRGFDVDGVCSNWGWDFNVRRGLDAEAARKEAAVKRPARKSLISAHPTRFSTRVQIEQMFHGVLSIVAVDVKRRRGRQGTIDDDVIIERAAHRGGALLWHELNANTPVTESEMGR